MLVFKRQLCSNWKRNQFLPLKTRRTTRREVENHSIFRETCIGVSCSIASSANSSSTLHFHCYKRTETLHILRCLPQNLKHLQLSEYVASNLAFSLVFQPCFPNPCSAFWPFSPWPLSHLPRSLWALQHMKTAPRKFLSSMKSTLLTAKQISSHFSIVEWDASAFDDSAHASEAVWTGATTWAVLSAATLDALIASAQGDAERPALLRLWSSKSGMLLITESICVPNVFDCWMNQAIKLICRIWLAEDTSN